MNGYDVIHLKYQLAAYRTVQRAYDYFKTTDIKILKTDAFNEAQVYFPIATAFDSKKVTCLEINPQTCKHARLANKQLNVIEGSVTEIPFGDGTFHVIMDFSTIDHVRDYEKVLAEYKRTLKENGFLFLVTWLGRDEWSNKTIKDSWGGDQHYFDEKEFVDCLRYEFTVIRAIPFEETMKLSDVHVHQSLYAFDTRKYTNK